MTRNPTWINKQLKDFGNHSESVTKNNLKALAVRARERGSDPRALYDSWVKIIAAQPGIDRVLIEETGPEAWEEAQAATPFIPLSFDGDGTPLADVAVADHPKEDGTPFADEDSPAAVEDLS